MKSAIAKFLGALMLLAWLPGAASAAEKLSELSVDEVAKRLGQKNVYVFDCNPKEEWKEGHLPTAKWVDFSNLQASDLPADKTATLIFYCQNEH
jgi:rhodanese-related sulfurtransferase